MKSAGVQPPEDALGKGSGVRNDREHQRICRFCMEEVLGLSSLRCIKRMLVHLLHGLMARQIACQLEALRLRLMQVYICLFEYLQASLIGVGCVVMLQEMVIQQLQQLCRWQQAWKVGTQQGGGQQGVHSGWGGCKWEALRLQQGQAGSRQELVQDGWRGG